jgi:hypothetical protein
MEIARLKSFKLLTVTFLLLYLSIFTFGDESSLTDYRKLDSKIVKAYNSIPRNSLDVYLYSMKILKKSKTDNTVTGQAWMLKARKLITISCFFECTRAIDKKLYLQAYIWAERGVKRGTAFGRVGNVSLKSLYDYLNYSIIELQKTPMVKNTDRKEILRQIDKYQSSPV